MLKNRGERGYSLIEWLVALSIGGVLMVVMLKIYLGAQSSYLLQKENAALYEDASYAMSIMAQHLRQAGFGHIVVQGADSATDLVNPAGEALPGLRGCDAGFQRPAYTCRSLATAASSGFEVQYRVPKGLDTNSGAGGDCRHAEILDFELPPTHPAYADTPYIKVAINRFYVENGTLSCHGNGGQNGGSQPILEGVEVLRVTYGVAMAAGFRFLSASQVDALSEDPTANWRRVRRVDLCLQLQSQREILETPQRHFEGCDDEGPTTQRDRRLRWVLHKVVALRNHLD